MDTSYYTMSDTKIKMPKGEYRNIQYIVIDVDGTMTDGGVYYDERGNELKKFCTKDAAGFFASKMCGIKIIVLTGRECDATYRRMKELQVEHIVQNIKNKYEYLVDFMQKYNISSEQLAYIGDDLNDLKSMSLAFYKGCPHDAAEEIKKIADYVSEYDGGYGAVRDVICNLLEQRGQWNWAISNCYKCDIGI